MFFTKIMEDNNQHSLTQKMNAIIADELEMNDLRSQLSELAAQIKAIKAEKERVMKKIVGHKDQIARLKDEIERRKESPELYPLGAGAGTIADVENDIESLETKVSTLEDEAADFDQPIEDFEETRHQVLFVMADKIGLETLKKQRTAIGKEMAKHNRLQHEAYKLQKERYEKCKRKTGFTPEDRAYIAHFKGLNEDHTDEWLELCDKRHELCELIDALDPNDEDLGLDEEEDV